LDTTHRIARLALVATVLAAGCHETLYHDLDERDANHMVVALEQSGIDAEKTADDRDPERWAVQVPSGTHVEAIHALESRGLPRPEVHGFDAFYPSQGLVPTAGEERVLLQYATAQELRRSLLAVDGVVDGHVNLVLPERRRVIGGGEAEPARASVIVKYDASDDTPLTSDQVRQLIAGGVAGLEQDRVSVLLTPSRAAIQPLEEPRLVQVGPLSVPPGTQTLTRLVFGLLTSVILGLAAALALVLVRRRR
jgi:type III secretion protein J